MSRGRRGVRDVISQRVAAGGLVRQCHGASMSTRVCTESSFLWVDL